MQRRVLCGALAAVVFPLALTARKCDAKEKQLQESKKTLVIYFSRAGMNYWSGKIINLKVGNTALLAQEIAKQTNAELLEIVPRMTYPFEYRAATDLAQKEISEQARPEISTQVPDLSNYGEVYLGFPIWWGLAPRPVITFVEHCRWEGKTVHLFCTHEGSGITQGATELKKALSGASVDIGPTLAGHDIANRVDVVKRYLQGINN